MKHQKYNNVGKFIDITSVANMPIHVIAAGAHRLINYVYAYYIRKHGVIPRTVMHADEREQCVLWICIMFLVARR